MAEQLTIETLRRRHRAIKRLIICIIGAVIACLVVIFVAIVVIRSSPDIKLFKSIQHSLQIPARLHVTTATSDVTVILDGQRYEINGTYNHLPIDLISDGDIVYFKTSEPQQLYQSYFASSIPPTITAYITPLLPTLANRWIALDTTTLPSSAQCALQTKNNLSIDPSALVQLYTTYSSNKFFTISSSSHSHQTVYHLEVDSQRMATFSKAVTKTNFYQSLTNCSTQPSPLALHPTSNATISATVDDSSNTLSAMTIASSRQTATISATYNDVKQPAVPQDSVSINALIEQKLGGLIGA